MKMQDVQRDMDRVEQGEWIGDIPNCSGLSVLVRGSNNKDWRRMVQRMIAAVPRQKKPGGTIDPDEMDRITSTVVLETALLDWKGITGADDQEILYSKAKAKDYLSDDAISDFRDGVVWACEQVGRTRAEEAKEIAKN